MKNKNFSPYMNNLVKEEKEKISPAKLKTYTSIKKIQSTKVEIDNFHKPISKIMDFNGF